MGSRPGNKCRLCFSLGFFHINLFTTSQKAIDAIRDIFHCEVEQSDSLPNHICVDCWMTLKKFHEFYRKVIEKQKKFQCEQLNVIKIDDPADSTSYMVCEEPPTFHIDVNEVPTEIVKFEAIEQDQPDEPDELDEPDEQNDQVIDFIEAISSVSMDKVIESFNLNEPSTSNTQEDNSNSENEIDENPVSKMIMQYYEKDLIPPPPQRVIRKSRRRERFVLKFECDYCPKRFTHQYRLNVHLKAMHGFGCSVCKTKHHTEEKLRQHMMIHLEGFGGRLRRKLKEINAINTENDVDSDEGRIIWNNFDLKCEKCETEFYTFEHATNHYDVKHKEKGYVKCCNMKLFTEANVTEHISYHINPDIYTCFVCDKSFKMKTNFVHHLRNHVNELLDNANERFCEDCGQLCQSDLAKRVHSAKHSEKVDKPKFQCTICGVWLSSIYILDRHTALHISEKQECQVCGRMISSPYAYKEHMRRMHGERPKCHICEKTFCSFKILTNHMRKHAQKKTLAVKSKAKAKVKESAQKPTQKSTQKPAPTSEKQKCSTSESNKAAIDCDPLDPWSMN